MYLWHLYGGYDARNDANLCADIKFFLCDFTWLKSMIDKTFP